jgi:hypothetical protein
MMIATFFIKHLYLSINKKGSLIPHKGFKTAQTVGIGLPEYSSKQPSVSPAPQRILAFRQSPAHA